MLGEEDPERLFGMLWLAHVMEQLGRQADALLLCKRAVAGFSTSLGLRHSKRYSIRKHLKRYKNDAKSEENEKTLIEAAFRSCEAIILVSRKRLAQT